MRHYTLSVWMQSPFRLATFTASFLLEECERLNLDSHAKAIRRLLERGCTYSNEDFDILSAAHRAIDTAE